MVKLPLAASGDFDFSEPLDAQRTTRRSGEKRTVSLCNCAAHARCVARYRASIETHLHVACHSRAERRRTCVIRRTSLHERESTSSRRRARSRRKAACDVGTACKIATSACTIYERYNARATPLHAVHFPRRVSSCARARARDSAPSPDDITLNEVYIPRPNDLL